MDEPFIPDRSISNGASLAFLFEFEGKRLAFLGDAWAEECLDGLGTLGYSREYPCQTSLVKLSHHVSPHNFPEELAQTLRAPCFLLSTKPLFRIKGQKITIARLLKQGQSVTIILNCSSIGENEMLPVVCKSITQYKEAWLTRVQEDFPEDSMLYGICLGQLQDERCLETAGLSAPVVLVRAGKSLLYIDRQQLLPGLSDKQYAGVVRVMYGRGIWLYRKDGTWHCGMEDSPLETDRSQVEIQLLDKVPEARGFLTLSCQSMELMWLPYENVGLMGEYLGTDRTTETVWEALEASAHFANQMKPISATGSNVRRARLLENRSVSLVNVNRTKHDSEILAVGTKLRATPLVQLDQQKKQVMFRYMQRSTPKEN